MKLAFGYLILEKVLDLVEIGLSCSKLLLGGVKVLVGGLQGFLVLFGSAVMASSLEDRSLHSASDSLK